MSRVTAAKTGTKSKKINVSVLKSDGKNIMQVKAPLSRHLCHGKLDDILARWKLEAAQLSSQEPIIVWKMFNKL